MPKLPRNSSSASQKFGPKESRRTQSRFLTFWLTVLVAGLILTWMFWWPLWQGGGLVGGDLYPYYFPQKAFLADVLKQGEIPLWNPLVGFGYPVLGESQTAALYPPNLILYRFLSVNTAYNVSQLGHYLFAFVGAVLLAMRLGLNRSGGLLVATVFVFGWFPSRICLEWAIIGGAWFVWILWGAASLLKTGERRYGVYTAFFLGMDLLAGHYNLAFITLLALIPLPWLVRPDVAETPIQATTFWKRLVPNRSLLLWSSIGLGFLLASVQILPSWELKSVSQRKQVDDVFSPTFGALPPKALSQLWMPWSWYAGERTFDEYLAAPCPLSVPSSTNQVEAQFYLGLLPLILVIIGLAIPGLRKELPLAHHWGWLAVILVSLLFATGWPTYYLSSVPGIGFFRGPGRYSIVAALGIALLAGASLDALLKWRRLPIFQTGVITALILSVTAIDLWMASRQYQFPPGPAFGRQVFYTLQLNYPPIKFLDRSVLRAFFAEQGGDARLYAPGANIPTLLNVSAVPVYLGLGPQIYETDLVRVDFSQSDPEPVKNELAKLFRLGVTHLVLEHPLDPSVWPVERLGETMDEFLNRALARHEPYYFYRVIDSPGRVSLIGAESGTIHSIESGANRVQVEVTAPAGGTLMLRDLKYVGWTCTHETSTKEGECDPLFRCVSLPASPERQTVMWTYRPKSVLIGSILSVMGLLVLIAGWLNWIPKSLAPVVKS